MYIYEGGVAGGGGREKSTRARARAHTILLYIPSSISRLRSLHISHLRTDLAYRYKLIVTYRWYVSKEGGPESFCSSEDESPSADHRRDDPRDVYTFYIDDRLRQTFPPARHGGLAD